MRHGRRHHHRICRIHGGSDKAGHERSGKHNRKDGLHRHRHTSPYADGDDNRRRRDDKQDVAKADLESLYRVAESKPKTVSTKHIAHYDRQCRGVQPDDRGVGKAEEPRAKISMVMSERRRRIGIDPAWPRLVVAHVVEVPGNNRHDATGGKKTQQSAERPGLGEKRRPRQDDSIPAYCTSKGKGPGGKSRKVAARRRFHSHPTQGGRQSAAASSFSRATSAADSPRSRALAAARSATAASTDSWSPTARALPFAAWAMRARGRRADWRTSAGWYPPNEVSRKAVARGVRAGRAQASDTAEQCLRCRRCRRQAPCRAQSG